MSCHSQVWCLCGLFSSSPPNTALRAPLNPYPWRFTTSLGRNLLTAACMHGMHIITLIFIHHLTGFSFNLSQALFICVQQKVMRNRHCFQKYDVLLLQKIFKPEMVLLIITRIICTAYDFATCCITYHLRITYYYRFRTILTTCIITLLQQKNLLAHTIVTLQYFIVNIHKQVVLCQHMDTPTCKY